MANKNVQFFRLGFDSPIKRNTYNSFIKDEHGQFIVDGRIVFANVKEEDLSIHKYIYANGIEYKVVDASDFDALVKRVEDVSQYAIDNSAALVDLSTFIRAEVSDLSTHVRTVTDASVTTLETWKSTHVAPSLNAFDSSLIDHETRITNLADASLLFQQIQFLGQAH